MILFAGLLLLMCGNMTAQQMPQTASGQFANFRHPDEAAKLISGSTEFAINLYKKLSADGQNVFFSPMSISVAMAMTYLGSGSSTSEEMKKVLGFAGISDEHVHQSWADLQTALRQTEGNYALRLANRIYGNQGYPFLAPFLGNAKKLYGAELQNVNFGDDAARQAINKWVADQTANKIQNLLAEPLDPMTRLVLVNAIYFKGDWASKFDAAETSKEDFFLSCGEAVKVDMMHMERNLNLRWLHELDTHMLELPYKGETLSMVVLLPAQTGRLNALDRALTPSLLARLPLGRPGEMDVLVSLPRFQLEQSISLADTLAAMGMPELFTMGKADLSAMDGSRDLFLSEVVHKAFIDVNEKGSEAAAATSDIIWLGDGPHVMKFTADHPFVFFIRDNSSGSILFMGKFEKPEACCGHDEL